MNLFLNFNITNNLTALRKTLRAVGAALAIVCTLTACNGAGNSGSGGGGGGGGSGGGGNTPLSSKAIAAYVQSWSLPWASDPQKFALANEPSYISTLLLSFATPNSTYVAGSNNFTGSGLQFSSDFSVVKQAIAIAKQKKQTVLISVGGASYPYQGMTQANAQSLVALMNDLGADGLDIDFEETESCVGDVATLTCTQDDFLKTVIEQMKAVMPAGKYLTAATFSVGAYGTSQYPIKTNLPATSNSGMWVHALQQEGGKLDALFVMSYDAGNTNLTGYNPQNAVQAYRVLFNGPIYFGLEVPPEAWGGNVTTPEQAQAYAQYAVQNNFGIMLWSLEKTGNIAGETVNAFSYMQPVCVEFGQNNCQQVPL